MSHTENLHYHYLRDRFAKFAQTLACFEFDNLLWVPIEELVRIFRFFNEWFNLATGFFNTKLNQTEIFRKFSRICCFFGAFRHSGHPKNSRKVTWFGLKHTESKSTTNLILQFDCPKFLSLVPTWWRGKVKIHISRAIYFRIVEWIGLTIWNGDAAPPSTPFALRQIPMLIPHIPDTFH